MLTTFFLGAFLIAPPPLPPAECLARVTAQHPRDPRLMVVVVFATWEQVPEMQEMSMRWNPDAPPGVFLVECTSRTMPLKIFWSGPRQEVGLRVFPLRTHFPWDLREVWFRDVYGRVVKKIPLKYIR